jgi:serine acetyltransferase
VKTGAEIGSDHHLLIMQTTIGGKNVTEEKRKTVIKEKIKFLFNLLIK